MDPGVEEHLIGVNIADPGDPGLIEEEALDAASSHFKDIREVGESDFERFGAQARELAAGAFGRAVEAEEETELPDVAEAELVPAVLELYGQAHMLVARLRLGGEQELAGHLEVEDERPAAFDLDEEHLAPASNAEDPAADQAAQAARPAAAEQRPINKIDPGDDTADQGRGERPGDRLDFREFGHGDILACPWKT